MRKLLLGIIVCLCLPFQTFGRESVGFSDPDNIQPLLYYRLPEWGYTNFSMDFSTDGLFEKENGTIENTTETDNQYSGRRAPTLLHLKESEARMSRYRISSSIRYDFRDRNSFTTNDNRRDELRISANWAFNEKFYINDSDYFFTGNFYGNYNQETDWDNEISESTTEVDEKMISRFFSPAISIGIGYGRLRNVNPVIRSLRLNERLQKLNSSESLNIEDVMRAADQFTRLNGYQQSYDRP